MHDCDTDKTACQSAKKSLETDFAGNSKAALKTGFSVPAPYFFNA
jgi:hypothetical protein